MHGKAVPDGISGDVMSEIDVYTSNLDSEKFAVRLGNSVVLRRGRSAQKGGIRGGWGQSFGSYSLSKSCICYNICMD